MTEVHVFIVNYNSSGCLERCVASLATAGVSKIHIIDNFFDTNERLVVSEIAKNNSGTDAILLDNNIGFGAALNLGIARVQLNDDDVVWLLNPDTIVWDGAVQGMTSALAKFDIVSPLLLTGRESSPKIWFAGGRLDMKRVRTQHSGLGEPWNHASGVEATLASTFITGAAMMMRYGTWVSIGGFRESFFLYWEDADLSYRAVSRGLRLGVAENALVWHAVGGSGDTDGKSSTYYYHMQRNRIWFARQWQSRWSTVVGTGILESIALSLRPLRERSGRTTKFLASLQGLRDGFLHRPL